MRPIAVSMGDPAGVGPEVIAKLVVARPDARLALFGDRRAIGDPIEGMHISWHETATQGSIIKGQGDPNHAAATKAWIENAVQFVRDGHARGLLTAPINKAMIAAGTDFDYPGHTEFLAALDGGNARPVMMITAEGVLRVVPATIHIPIADVPAKLNAAMLGETIAVIDRDLAHYLGKRPRIALAGLNPHAGENGRIGVEEANWLNGFAQSMRKSGFDVTDPLPADTMFHTAARARYDVALCMYHDQALIPIKTLAFDTGVNVTLGLSFLRASPDHGTAYDIAGKGIASPNSMIAAYDLLDKWTRQ